MTYAYLCGPVSNGGTLTLARVNENREKFKQVRAKFAGSHVIVLDPTEMVKHQETWEDFMKITIPMVCRASFVVLLPGWEDSRGAIMEIFIANSLNIPIFFSDHLPI